MYIHTCIKHACSVEYTSYANQRRPLSSWLSLALLNTYGSVTYPTTRCQVSSRSSQLRERERFAGMAGIEQDKSMAAVNSRGKHKHLSFSLSWRLWLHLPLFYPQHPRRGPRREGTTDRTAGGFSGHGGARFRSRGFKHSRPIRFCVPPFADEQKLYSLVLQVLVVSPGCAHSKTRVTVVQSRLPSLPRFCSLFS